MSDPQTISLSPAIVHFEDLVQGNTLAFQISLTDAAGDAIPITADEFEMEIRRPDGSLVLALGVGNGLEFTDPGKLYGEVESADTVGLDPDYEYVYEVLWTNSGFKRSISWGKIQSKKRVVGLT